MMDKICHSLVVIYVIVATSVSRSAIAASSSSLNVASPTSYYIQAVAAAIEIDNNKTNNYNKK
jgi:hypothetical protein